MGVEKVFVWDLYTTVEIRKYLKSSHEIKLHLIHKMPSIRSK